MSGDRIVLRYFPLVGRAQAIRHSLMDAGVDFEDLRVRSDWLRHQGDPAFSGSYRALPTLSWGELLVSETLPIASFMARRLGQYAGLDEKSITRHEAFCSSAFLDVVLRLAGIIRADQTYPGADAGQALVTNIPSILKKTELLDREIEGAAWIGGDGPVVADFFAGEAFEVLCYVLGPDRALALRERLPRLAALALAVRERPRLAGAMQSRPARFTGRPDEDRVIQHFRGVDLSSIGL
jgi:glutathione S-transferase